MLGRARSSTARVDRPPLAAARSRPDTSEDRMGSVIKKRRKRMAKKKHRKLLRKTRHQRRNKK
ncbi:hypothetical protein GCM10023113_32710 [Cellulomonas oligotrophica]|uniref:Ribosomal protein mS38 C-terminal domain-containing protein n=1 Tax=Cellulomonas oligotrophica TaxID=931536 RepID=A0ABQ4D6N1_9CELL|nr:hypothetical protein Col01nite_05470 [Cellulomonas oligotrophica]